MAKKNVVIVDVERYEELIKKANKVDQLKEYYKTSYATSEVKAILGIEDKELEGLDEGTTFSSLLDE